MLSSSDISALFAQQQASFSQQQAFAQQIGANVPNASLAGWGAPPRPAPAVSMGMPSSPQAFSYAPAGIASGGYGMGNRMAGGVMSGIGGAANLAGAGLGVASMFGRMGAVAPLMDPFAGAMTGYGMGSAMGMGMAGSLGMGALGAMPALGLAYGASKMVGSFVHGGQQQAGVNSALGGFGFYNQHSRTGAGFTRDDGAAIGAGIRQLSEVPELMTSMGELTKLIPKLRGMGVMQGVRDATEFSSRFKEAVNTIRDVSKVLGTTMSEASEFFAHSRSSGFLGHQAQLKNVLSAQFTSAQTGMTMGQVMDMQSTGAGMATGMGIKRKVGATAVTNMAQMLQAGVDNKSLSQGTLEDISGKTGAEAVGASAEILTDKMAQIAKGTSAGRLSMYYLADFDKTGKYVGVNKERAERMKMGDVSVQEMKRRVGRFTNNEKLGVTNRIDSLSMEYAGMSGIAGFGSLMKNIAGGRGDRYATGIMRHYGIDESEGDAILSQAGQGGSGDGGLSDFTQSRARETAIREQSDPHAIWRRIKTKVHTKFLGGIEQAGADVQTKIGKAWDDFVDDAVGRHVVSISKQGSKAIGQALNSPEGKQKLFDMFKAASGLKAPEEQASSIGRFVAGGAAASMGLLGGGALLSGGGLNKAGLGVDHAARSLMSWVQGESSSTTTGRSAAGQYSAMKEAFGGGSDSATAARMGDLIKFGQSNAANPARDLVQGMISSIPGFADASNAQKQKLLQEKIGGVLSSGPSTGSIISAVMSGGATAGGMLPSMWNAHKNSADRKTLEAGLAQLRKNKLLPAGMSDAAALSLYGAGNGRSDRFGSGGLLDKSGAEQFNTVAGLDDMMKIATNSMNSTLGSGNEDITSNLQDRPGYAQAISTALGGDKELDAALMSSTGDAEAAAVLKKRGITVDPGDIAGLRDNYKRVVTKSGEGSNSKERAENRSKIAAGIQSFGNINKGKDFLTWQSKLKGTASSITDKGLSAATMAMGSFKNISGESGADRQARWGATLDSFTKAQGAIVDQYMGAKDDYSRNKIIESAGDMGGSVVAAAAEKRHHKSDDWLTGKKFTAKELAAKLGTDESSVAAGGYTEGTKLTADVIKKIRGAGSSEIMLAGTTKGAEQAGSKDQQIIDALTKLNKTMDLTASILDLKFGDLKGKNAEDMKNHVVQSSRENLSTSAGAPVLK